MKFSILGRNTQHAISDLSSPPSMIRGESAPHPRRTRKQGKKKKLEQHLEQRCRRRQHRTRPIAPPVAAHIDVRGFGAFERDTDDVIVEQLR